MIDHDENCNVLLGRICQNVFMSHILIIKDNKVNEIDVKEHCRDKR